MMSKQIVVDLVISSSEYQRYYSGSVSNVLATTVDGLKVRFPASVLQKVVSHDGISGRFAITFSDAGKFEKIERIR
ncbi:MAG: DUF2835 domain-containing protein [Alcanivorax sp.]|jgi:hypothetical protein|tara:strand:+ start:8179 stop:8406 length:228 start_codon:yes stop_codon:yes gene_type:complete